MHQKINLNRADKRKDNLRRNLTWTTNSHMKSRQNQKRMLREKALFDFFSFAKKQSLKNKTGTATEV